MKLKEHNVVGEELKEAAKEAVVGELTGKKWYVSKTFWANVVAGAAVAVQSKYGFVVGPEYQMLGMVVVNLILRKITKQPVVW